MKRVQVTDSLSSFADENLRRVAARATHQIALRRGRSLSMWIGCGYPKSGTVWLCQLMANYLGIPYPQNYLSPIAMQSVIHAHWRWDLRLPPVGYIVRDGRDVMVSFYFFHMRALENAREPSLRYKLHRRYSHLFGRGFDPTDARANLPRFIDYTLRQGPITHGMPWHEHVADWACLDRPNVSVVRYEDLLSSTAPVLADLMGRVTGLAPSMRRAQLAAERFSFAETAGRREGEENRASFQRKGIAGDWRNYFTQESKEVFHHYAGEVLIQMGYESHDRWVHESGVSPTHPTSGQLT